MRSLQQLYLEAYAQHQLDISEVLDRAYDSVLRLGLDTLGGTDTLGPRDQQLAFELLDIAEAAADSEHLEDREGAAQLRALATKIGEGLKSAIQRKSDQHLAALDLKHAPTPEEVRLQAEARQQRELVQRFNDDYVKRQAWLPSRLGDLEAQRQNEAEREASAHGRELSE